ncbi:MAG: sugar ABC transporter permease [Actinomycetales bacterium]|nr:sugar ABC transporter permease [Actinomycetales bacterium]
MAILVDRALEDEDEDDTGRSWRGRVSARQRRETAVGWAFMLPDAIGLMIFVVLPIIVALAVAFFSIDGFGQARFVGLDNFVRMGSDPLLVNSLAVTLIYAGCYVPLVFVAGLALALLVQRPFPGIGIVRTLFFLPNVMSLVVIAILWQFMLTDKTGFVPRGLSTVGLGDISWLGNPTYALAAIIMISVWFQAGYQMLLFLGGLGDIPNEYHDAAKLDGAGWWQRLFWITLPLLKPTSFFIAVTSIIGAVTGMQAFDLVFVLTKGGPANSTMTMPFYIYQQAFSYNDYGYAAALTTLLVGVLVLAVGVTFAATKGARFHAE